jgi:hypothetical protein
MHSIIPIFDFHFNGHATIIHIQNSKFQDIGWCVWKGKDNGSTTTCIIWILVGSFFIHNNQLFQRHTIPVRRIRLFVGITTIALARPSVDFIGLEIKWCTFKALASSIGRAQVWITIVLCSRMTGIKNSHHAQTRCWIRGVGISTIRGGWLDMNLNTVRLPPLARGNIFTTFTVIKIHGRDRAQCGRWWCRIGVWLRSGSPGWTSDRCSCIWNGLGIHQVARRHRRRPSRSKRWRWSRSWSNPAASIGYRRSAHQDGICWVLEQY